MANRRNVTSEDLENEVLAKITQYTNNGFPEAKRLHEVIMAAGTRLYPRLWYGMPGYAKTKDSAVLCFFRKYTLISFGFTEAIDISQVNLNEKPLVPSAWYVTNLNQEAEDKITEIVLSITQ